MDADGVNVFAYLDHRKLLADLYRHRKAKEYGFSYRTFARRAGLRSFNYLKLVMDGQRNLSAEMAVRFTKGFGLKGQEAEFFCELVAYNQARTAAERSLCYQRFSRFKQYRKLRKLDADQAAYHGRWFLPAIRELAARPGFRNDPKWIARQLQPRITAAQAREALGTLSALGLLTEDGEGRLRQADPLVTTGAGPLGHHIVEYHRAMLSQAAQALDGVPRDEREISSVTLCTSHETMLQLKERIREFRRELLQLAEQQGEAERVVQINFQLFPLSQRPESNDDDV